MTKEIIFTSPLEGIIDPPKPSLLTIPDAYKNLSKTIKGKPHPGYQTIKACIPFLDALTVGYIISFPADFCFRIEEEKNDKGEVRHHVKAFMNDKMPESFLKFFTIETHEHQQMPSSLRSNYRTVDIIFKIINPWHIKTPSGYSCIFTNPFNRNTPFKIIDGIVDTDSFPVTVNFPAFWTKDASVKDTIVEKGTPLALVIPFKREQWKMKTMNGAINEAKTFIKFSSIFKDNYKKMFWNKKSFK